jgi:hypothetical protein
MPASYSANLLTRWPRLTWLPLLGSLVMLGLLGVANLPRKVALAQDLPPRTPPKIRPGGTQPSTVPAVPLTEEQKRLRLAVHKGVLFLKATQNAKGTWNNGEHEVGYAAMPGLAMLEVGVPANDLSIKNAAYHVRVRSAKLTNTYDLALAILFLDKLGERGDIPIIRALALRLIAGQTTNGGWSYHCPLLTPLEEQQLVVFLQKNHPRIDPLLVTAQHPHVVPLPKNLEKLINPLTRREKDFSQDPLSPQAPLFDNLLNPLPKDPKAGKLDLFDPLAKPDFNKKEEPLNPLLGPDKKLTVPFEEKDPTDVPKRTPPKIKPGKGSSPGPVETKPEPPSSGEAFSPENTVELDKRIPVVVEINKWASVPDFFNQMRNFVPKGKGKGKGPDMHQRDDNSNTQFAILGLWAARRHGIPMTLTLAKLDERFRTTQTNQGTWDYHVSPKGFGGNPGTPSMTCVGLLGLGIAHGVFHEATSLKEKKAQSDKFFYDPAIQKGLAALGQAIGPGTNGPRLNLYFLWSLERVCVMYHLPTLKNIDWHGWGSQLLLARQTNHGSWNQNGFPGSSETLDTAMALLFLGRINLSRDLSENLRQNLVVLDPARVQE